MLHFRLIFQSAFRVETTAPLSYLLHATQTPCSAGFTPNCPYDLLAIVLTSCGLVCDVHLRIFEHTGTGPPGYPWVTNKVTGHMLKIWEPPSKRARPWLWETGQPRRVDPTTGCKGERNIAREGGREEDEYWIAADCILPCVVTVATFIIAANTWDKSTLRE